MHIYMDVYIYLCSSQGDYFWKDSLLLSFSHPIFGWFEHHRLNLDPFQLQLSIAGRNLTSQNKKNPQLLGISEKTVHENAAIVSLKNV